MWVFFGLYTSPTSMNDEHTKHKAQNSKYWQINCDVMAGKLVTYYTGTHKALCSEKRSIISGHQIPHMPS